MNQVTGRPLKFSACENFRELGGYCGLEGKRVKYGMFYRTPALAALTTPQDLEQFRALGIRTIFDFRSSGERKAQPDPQFEGVEQIAISAIVDAEGSEVNFDFADIFSQGRVGIDAMQEMLAQHYRALPFGNPAYRAMFRAIAAGATPLLFHCTAGKDRTGVAAALILKALGVSRADIVADYLKTNECRANSRQNLAALMAQTMPEDMAHQLAQTVGGVQEESICMVLDEIDARYPVYETYLAQECDFGPAELTRLRAVALE